MVLIIALLLLIIISLLAINSMHTAASTETVSNNNRVVILGNQAAEIALRYCEEATTQQVNGAVTLASVPSIQDYAASPKWRDLNNWDSTRTGVFVLPDSTVNQSGLAYATYSRRPECIVERVPVFDTTTSTTNTNRSFVITARGFGPEVADGTARPSGGEFWMQSTIDIY